LVEVNTENPVSHRYMLVKGRNIVIVFSDNLVFLFYTRSELTDDRLLRIICNVESEVILLNFLSSDTLKSIGLPCTSVGLLAVHDFLN